MTKAYLDVLRNSLLLKNAKENVESTEKIYNDVKSLYDAGLTTKSEMIKIQASLSLAKSNYIVQQNNFMDKEFSFEKLYGKKVSVNELNKPELAFIPTKEEIDKLIVNNPSVFISQYNIESERALIKEKESKFYPIVNLEVEQTYNEYSKQNGFDGEDDRQRVGVTLNWNFYNGGKDKLEIEKQKVNVLKTKSSKEEIERQVKEGMELSYSAYTMLEKQLENLKEYNDFSLETLDKYKSEYELGRRTLLDLLSAQNDVVNSKSQLINAEFDRLFASYRILDSIGNINSYILEQKAELAEDDYYARLLKETASK